MTAAPKLAEVPTYKPPQDRPAAPAAAVINVRVQKNFGADQAVELLTHVPQDATFAEQIAISDRLFQLVDRQKAKHELAEMERAYRRMVEDRPNVQRLKQQELDTAVADLDVMIGSHRKAHDDAVADHNENRRGTFKETPQLRRLAEIVAGGQDKVAKLKAEVEEGERQFKELDATWQRNLKAKRDEIAELSVG
jgi:hypothetical protein